MDNTLRDSRINLMFKKILGKSFSEFKSLLLKVDQQIKHAEKAVNLNNPERQLTLGYSIARCNGRIIRTVKNTKIGDDIDIQAIDGKINSEAKRISFSSLPSPSLPEERLGK